MKTAAAIFAILFGSLALAGPPGSPPFPGTAPPGFPELPDVPAKKEDPKPPAADGSAILPAGTLYVGHFAEKVSADAFPPGVLKVRVTNNANGLEINARFFDGTGAEEDRFYKGPWIVRVSAEAKPAAAEATLVIIKEAKASRADWLVRTIRTGTSPIPPPVPVPVVDAFNKAVQDAYAADPGPEKAKHTAALARLYRASATTTVRDETVTTYAVLFKDMETASRALLPADVIPGVRKAIGGRLNPLMSLANAPINRAKAESEFLAVATALEGVK